MSRKSNMYTRKYDPSNYDGLFGVNPNNVDYKAEFNLTDPMKVMQFLYDTTNIGMNVKGIILETTASDLAAALETTLSNQGITEIDKIKIRPLTDSSGRIVGGLAVMYFITDPSDGKNSNIWFGSPGGNKGTINIPGGTDLRGLVGNFSQSNFHLSPEFITLVGSVAELNNNGEIVIEQDTNYPKIGIVRCDFFTLMDCVMGVGQTQTIDYEINRFEQIGGKNSEDYIIEFKKTYSRNRKKSGRKSRGVDYSRLTDNIARQEQNAMRGNRY